MSAAKFSSKSASPPRTPPRHLPRPCAWLRRWSQRLGHLALAAIGIASFGPVELDKASARYGFIGQTPKSGWRGTDIAGLLGAGIPVSHRFRYRCQCGGTGRTSLGRGAGRRQSRLSDHRHRDRRRRDRERRAHPRAHAPRNRPYLSAAPSPRPEFEGVCPFHRDCMEGLASGPAILARSGASLQQLDAGAFAVANRGRLSRSIVRAAGRDHLAAAHRHGRRRHGPGAPVAADS